VTLRDSAARAASLKQKIIDARLALTRLRHAHPEPRLTIPAADQRLADQVEQMQALTDEIEQASKKVQSVKGSVKSGAQEIETLRAERAEAEKAVKAARVNEDDGRLVPLYDQYVPLLSYDIFH
jgi:peptidoglycan hydrolase CwlO-like protein